MNRPVAVAVGLAAATAAIIAIVASSGPDSSLNCARQPSDGGTCLVRRTDGGTWAPGRDSFMPAQKAAGQCELFACPPEP